jgi:hypothetical protein
MKPTVSPQHSTGAFSDRIESSTKPTTGALRFGRFFLALPLLALTLLSACNPEEDVLPPANDKMEHRIEFSIAKAKEYSEPIYDEAKAELNLTISVEDLRDGSNTVLWDTVFSLRQLREFPAPDAPLVIKKGISRTAAAHQVLRLSNSARYFDRNNTTWAAAESEIVPRDFPRAKVEIVL